MTQTDVFGIEKIHNLFFILGIFHLGIKILISLSKFGHIHLQSKKKREHCTASIVTLRVRLV